MFPAVELAGYAGQTGGSLLTAYNAADQVAAAALLSGRIGLPAVIDTVADVLHVADQWAAGPATVDEVLDAGAGHGSQRHAPSKQPLSER